MVTNGLKTGAASADCADQRRTNVEDFGPSGSATENLSRTAIRSLSPTRYNYNEHPTLCQSWKLFDLTYSNRCAQVEFVSLRDTAAC